MMKLCRSSTRSIAARISGSIARNCAFRSTSGMRSELNGHPLPARGARPACGLQRRDNRSGLVGPGDRLGPVLDALHEVARLRDERLGRRQPRDVQVAEAVDQLELAE